MTIRYQCDDCGSVLKIKDQLAGTEGKCPKCKKKFIVPEPAPSLADESGEIESPSEDTVVTSSAKLKHDSSASSAKKTEKSKPKAAATDAPPEPPSDALVAAKTIEQPAAKPAKEASPADDEFDAAAFLMEGNDGPNKPSAGLTSEPAQPQKGPAWARGGRRPIAPTPTDPEEAKNLSPAAAAANAQLSGASANARDLLSKSREESRVRAASLPPEKERGPVIDFSGFKQEIRQAAKYVVPVVIGVTLLYWGMSRMLADSIWVPELGRVSGRVTVDDKPFPNVRVNLTPVNPHADLGNGKTATIRTASGVTDENGYYEVYYMQGIRGAPVGNVRITLEPVVATPENIKKIPAKYAGNQGPPREVKKTGNDGEFDIDIKTGER